MPTRTIPRARPDDLLEAARNGDEAAFGSLVEPHRAELHGHCYRMLASLHDAEDALQDALLRAWRGLGGLRGPGALRSWLYTIATNACLDAIARRPKRVLPIDYGPSDPEAADSGPLPESTWIEPYPDERLGLEDGYASPEARFERREAIELAFIAALQNLPPRQRAVLILRDVLGFSAREVAGALQTTPASVNSAMQRARRAVDERLPERSQQATLRSLGDEGAREVVERFTDAFERADVDAIIAVLTDDAVLAMPPYPGWRRGREAVAGSWLVPRRAGRLRYVTTSANGQLAVGAYALEPPEERRHLPVALDVLTLRGSRVAQVLAFRDTRLFDAFGLPAQIER